MIKRRPIDCFLKMVGIVLGSAILGIILLWIVYLLPTESMAKNVADSKELLVLQDDGQFLLNEEYWKAYDLGTNIIILHEVIFPGSGNALQDSLLAPTADYISKWKENWTDILIEYATEREYSDEDYLTYARYWHGYLVVLKPLFMFMELQGIYIINGIVLFALTASVLFLLKKRIGAYWIVYLITLFTMNLYGIVQSFQLSSVFYVMQITVLLLLLNEKWEKEQILYIFVFDGVLLAFLDFLTYPFIAFAIPVLTSVLLDLRKSIKEYFADIVLRGVSFAIGYAGMWGMKWIFATIFTKENVIADAIESVLHRAGFSESTGDSRFMSISIPDALHRNLCAYFNEWTSFLVLIVALVVVVFIIKKRNTIKVDKQILFVSCLMFVSPFIWIMILHNHASLHPHLEWRTFAVLTYAVGIFVVSLFSKEKEGKNYNEE